MRRIIFLFVAVVAVLAACGHLRTTNLPGDTPGRSMSSVPTAVPPNGAQWSAWDAYSLPEKSQGTGSTAGGGTYSQVCPHVDPALEAARPDSTEKEKVYQAYGLTYPQPYGKYELDHIVAIEDGGAPDTPANLYPEPNTAPDPAMNAKWHLSPAFVHNPKDQLEDVLHQLICSNRVSMTEAQQALETDWVAAYHKYVEGMQP